MSDLSLADLAMLALIFSPFVAFYAWIIAGYLDMEREWYLDVEREWQQAQHEWENR